MYNDNFSLCEEDSFYKYKNDYREDECSLFVRFIDDMDMKEVNQFNGTEKSTEQDELEDKDKNIPEMTENISCNNMLTYNGYALSEETKAIIIKKEEDIYSNVFGINNQKVNDEDSNNELITEDNIIKEDKPSLSDINISKNSDEKRDFNDSFFTDQNLRRKVKHIVLNSFFVFINEKICEAYNNNIGKGACKKQLQALNKKQKSSSDIIFNKEFMLKPMGEIFSDKISGKYTNFIPDHNKRLIQKLLNEENLLIRNFFIIAFGFTFFQCLEHYRGTKYYPGLKGMKVFEDEISNFRENENYFNNLKYYLNNYETIINKKKSRKSKKNQTKNNF